MTIREALREGTDRLRSVETPFLDVSVLLAHTLGISKEQLFASFPDEITGKTLKQYCMYLEKRLSGYPVSYIRHRKEFFGLEFYVDERVLVPRPDTETLVELALDLSRTHKTCRRVHDVCTGTGCVALSIKSAMPELEVSASDISEDAAEVFFLNRKKLEIPVPFSLCSLLDGIESPLDIIVSNPPYLTDGEVRRMKAGNWPEPALALAAGVDGLDVIRKLIPQGLDSLCKDGYLCIEAASWQMPEIGRIYKEHGFRNITLKRDLGNRNRVIIGQK